MGWDDSYSGFNPDKAEAAGIFTKEETDKYIDDWFGQYDGSSVWYMDKFTPEETALFERFEDAYHHYDDVLADHGGNVQDESTKDDDPNEVPYDAYGDTDPKYDIDSNFEGVPGGNPKEYSGSNNPNGEMVVSTEAIEYFCRELDAIAPDGKGILLDARNSLKGIDMKPGTFAIAEVLRQRVAGASANDAGLRGDTMGLLETVHSALFDLKKNLREMVTEYQNAEDFNKMTADQLGDAMKDSWGYIESINDYGNQSTTAGGGAGDGEGEGEGNGDGT